MQPLEWQTQWDKGKSKDPAKRQDIFLFYWYPDFADPYSWFVNLFRSADPPYFNLSYYDSKPVDASIDTLQQKTATNKTRPKPPTSRSSASCSTEAVAVPLYVQNYQRVYQKSMTGYVDNPGVRQHRVHPRAASRVT